MFYYLQMNLNQLIMKKAGLLLGLLLLLGLNYQCTEDEDIQENVKMVNPYEKDGGEDGDQEIDTDRD